MLEQIAQKVRSACDVFAHSVDAVDYDFFVYSRGSYDASLRGMCGLASFALRDELIKAGYPAYVCLGDYWGRTHCWVRSGNLVIDITATQFDKEAVVIVPSITEEYLDWYRLDDMNILEWHDAQRPTQELVNTILNIANNSYTPEYADPLYYDPSQVDSLYKKTQAS